MKRTELLLEVWHYMCGCESVTTYTVLSYEREDAGNIGAFLCYDEVNATSYLVAKRATR